MERTKGKENDKERFRKIGGGSLRIGGKIIKPNQVFLAYPHEISEAFRDVVTPLDSNTFVKEEEKKVDSKKHEYILKARGVGGWYDVIDSNGKVKNEKALKREAALALIRSFEE